MHTPLHSSVPAMVTTAYKATALAYATELHSGQVHRDGKPALAHSLRVANKFTEDETLYAIAILHDTIEDCDPPADILRQIHGELGDRVMSGILALTRGKQESWSGYIKRVHGNPDAVRVKIADIEDNIERADAKMQPKLPMYWETLEELRTIAAFSTIQ